MGNKPNLSPWNGVVSGTAAAVLANVLVYPLDVVKTRLQVRIQQHSQHGEEESSSQIRRSNAADEIFQILREEGIAGFYSGVESSVSGTAAMNLAYFCWSAVARELYQSILQSYGVQDSNSIAKELGLGAVGGAMAQLCTNPIAVVSTRQQTRKTGEEKKSTWETTTEIVRSEDGWTGLWRGFKVNLILVVNPMITYGVYQWLRGGLVSVKKNIGSFDAFMLGALSKVLATVATHPLIVAKTMLQSKAPACRQGKPFGGFTEVLLYIVKHEGLFRVYKGLTPQIIKGFLVQGLMMMMKEKTELLLIAIISLYHRRLQRPSSTK